MSRSLVIAALAFVCLPLPLAPARVSLTSEDAKAEKPKVVASGSVEDEALAKEMPTSGVIVSEKGWEKLAKAWAIKDPGKIDFTKELLIVGTWKGSSFGLTPTVKDGDLTVSAAGTKDLRPGFRYQVVAIPREGIKTVKGKELPKE
jgi:hypothetical protein